MVRHQPQDGHSSSQGCSPTTQDLPEGSVIKTLNLAPRLHLQDYLYLLRSIRFCGPPWDIKEGVISDPMLLYSICLFVYLGFTCKNLDRNIKIWVRFQDLKFCNIEILHLLDKQKEYITQLILKKQDSNLTCKSDFYSRKNYILATRSKDQFLIN